MSSWRSRFRKTKTPDSHEAKTANSYSKTSDDADHHKKRRSRFLRRSKHEDDFEERPRPRSLYVERKTEDFVGVDNLTASSRNLAHTPTVQEILDRNRRERSSSKSPRPWRKFLTGERSDRSPGGTRKPEMNDDYVNLNRNGDTNHNYTTKYGSNDAIRQSYSHDDGGRYSKYRGEQKSSGSERKNSRWKNEVSSQKDDASVKSESEKSSGKGQSESSRSASPYDNVDGNTGTGSQRPKRQERQDYSETSSIADRPTTPQRWRRERMRRNDSQETVNSEKSSKESSTLRRPRALYPNDNDGAFQSRRNQSDTSKSLNSPRNRRKLSSGRESQDGFENDRSTRGQRINRTLGQSSYGRRSSENILGAALNYIERRISVDSTHSNSSKHDESSDSLDNSVGRRRRYMDLQAEKSMDNISTRESRNRKIELRRESYDNNEESSRRYYKSASRTAARGSDSSQSNASSKRDAYTRPRPKSLYDYSNTIKFSDTVAKYRGGSQNDENYQNTYSVWENYKPRSAYSSQTKQLLTDSTSDEKEAIGVARRPNTLYMAGEDKKDTTYRGNWSAKVPQRPAHLRDFSQPVETESSYGWRRKKSEDSEVRKKREKEVLDDREGASDKKSDRVSYRRRESQQQTNYANDDVTKDKRKVSIPSFEFTVSEPKDETNITHSKTSNEILSSKSSLDIAVVDEDSLTEKNSLLASENTVVRRRKKEHAPPARPSSIYMGKGNRDESDEESKKEKSYKKVDDDDDDYGSSYRSKNSSINLDSEDIKAGLRRKSAVERRLKSKYTKERPKSVHLADVFAVSGADNRHSSYLPSASKAYDPLRDTVDEVKREFEKLLRRTSNWKLRTESLTSKSSFLSNSYRSLNRAITGIRDESDNVCAIFDNIGERLSVNDSVGYPDTEDEWRRAFEGETLLAKATKLLDYQKRSPKPDFEYSESESEPETPGKPYYDMPEGIPWFSSSRRSSRLSSTSDTSSYSARQSDDFINGNSRSYTSYRPSLDVMSSLDVSSNTRHSPSLFSDGYSRRRRQEGTGLDYRRSSGTFNNTSISGRMIPETAV